MPLSAEESFVNNGGCVVFAIVAAFLFWQFVKKSVAISVAQSVNNNTFLFIILKDRRIFEL